MTSQQIAAIEQVVPRVDGDAEVVDIQHEARVVEHELHQLQEHRQRPAHLRTTVGEHGHLRHRPTAVPEPVHLVAEDLVHRQPHRRIVHQRHGRHDLVPEHADERHRLRQHVVQ